MNIIIVGAGRIGAYCATLLSQQHHRVVLIDKRFEKIDRLKEQAYIQLVCQDITSWSQL